MRKVGEGRRWIGEGADRTADRIFMMPNLRTGDHLSDPLLVPIGWPEVAVVHSEGEAGRPACQSRELPAADETVQDATGVASYSLASAERQFYDPVRIDLVGGVEI